MPAKRLCSILTAFVAVLSFASGHIFPNEDLILCDCGLGDFQEHPQWSTSRQMNWYQDIRWPDRAYAYPDPPDMSVEVPFNNGVYPWARKGATASMPNGDVWTVKIEKRTPDGFKAGMAYTTKDGGQMLNCWAYRGRPVSAAINKTVNPEAVCWSAFVCNRDTQAPPRPSDMGSQSSSVTTATSSATTTFYTPSATAPVPPDRPRTAPLSVSAYVNPRFINWQNTWDKFISKFVWDQKTGRCVGDPIKGDGYTIEIECAGIQIDEDSHMTLVLLEALRGVGEDSKWFSPSPKVPGENSSNRTSTGNSTTWVTMPSSFRLHATDDSNRRTVGYLSYKTTYDHFLSGQCSVCDTRRFNKQFFDPIIEAMKGAYPVYNSYHVSAQCDPWMVCK